MIKHNPHLEWYAFEFDRNTHEIKKTNVLNDYIIDRINKGLKSTNEYWKIDSYETLKKAVNNELMFHYWSKFEHEYEVKHQFEDKTYKLDVFYQLELNMDRIIEYIAREMNIKFNKEGKIILEHYKTRR